MNFEILKDKTEFEEFNKAHPNGHIFSSEVWGRLKSDWIREVVVARSEGKIVGGASVLIRKIPLLPTTLMYMPRGFVADPHDKEVIKTLAEGVGALAKKYKACEIKTDPDIPIEDKEFVKIMKDCGFYQLKGKKENVIQAKVVFRMNIDGKTEEDILEGMSSKTRYNLRLSERKGVVVRLGTVDDVEEFCRLLDITGKRDGFTSRSKWYYEKMIKDLGENARLYVAEKDGRAIAGTISLSYGDKTWYLYGASDNELRNLMPNYALQWEMIKWAVENKCRVYDFRGVTDANGDIVDGLVRFKQGFGGEMVEFCDVLVKDFNKPMKFLVNLLLSARKMLLKIRH